ncbi:7TM diverse intracellular signaling domain-containing protein [Leptospira borgpetersenii]|uniref:Signal transduction protein n=1 Tax=Leptospira borgpetersenii serovar Hardjo-bovis (strain JB197) TaxID=355277 RepID=Q04NL8_LEPBJ|nr:7TM diverse intracellular signaling domain-containing protein [Leptospira borgpetersenii]ABJ77502.1 Signal transduction protein [Leptospira borgpetersenii serovar Hardjo-bovis str. JB197]AMX72754.1 histidine kinase [Leptospira borgpetersenii serovar Hardjo]TQE56664.1 PAS domain-containing protein [Leptospira borgpetersenii]
MIFELRKSKTIFFLILAWSGAFFAIHSEPSAEFEPNAVMKGWNLQPYLTYYEDKSGELSFSEIQSIFRSGKSIPLFNTNLGYSDATIWVRIPVSNSEKRTKNWVLLFSYCLIDSLQFYSVRNGLSPLVVSGDKLPFATRLAENRNFPFQLSEPPLSKNDYYIRIESKNSLIIPLSAYSRTQFLEQTAKEYTVLGLYYGTMFVMFIYNLFLLITIRDISYLYYSIFIFFDILFQMTLNGLSFQFLWPNNPRWGNVSLPFFMFSALLAACLFGKSFLESSKMTPITNKFYYPIIAICGFGCVGSLTFFTYTFSVISSIIVLLIVLTLLLTNSLQCVWKGHRPARFFLMAWSVLIFGSFLYAMSAFGVFSDNFFTQWGLQIGSAIEVALLSLGLADRIKQLSLTLEMQMTSLGLLKQRHEQSAVQYKNLYEGEEDFLFDLDFNGTITGSNKSISTFLGFKSQDVIGKNFFDLVYKTGSLEDVFKKLYVMEKMEELYSTRKPVYFRVDFVQKYLKEPKELQVRLQVLEHKYGRDILGRAFEPDRDLIGRFLDEERIVFSMDNSLQNAELLSQRLTFNLIRFTNPAVVLSIRTGLREILVNSIEHGNLNISDEDKTRSLKSGNYFQFILTRQNDSHYRDKKILVEYFLSSQKVGYRITDEGKGFNHARIVRNALSKTNENTTLRTRGIAFALSTFDVVKFNSTGNRVTLVKYF